MNSSVKKKFWICFSLIVVILAADQILKFWIKTHLTLGESIDLIGNWFKLNFVENEGMAFGMTFGGHFGKLFLSLFRLIASVFIMWFLVKQIKKDARYVIVITISLIFVGAIGNIIDSCFYGIIFSESTTEVVATLFPEGGGYGTFLHGKVVDMLYMPICEWTWPSWMPWIGGGKFEFFNAIYNIADAAITVGIVILIVDQIFLQRNRKSDTEEMTTENGD